MIHEYFLAHAQIDDMLKVLQNKGYKCVAPRYIDGAINYATLNQARELPWGMEDEQGSAHYKVIKTGVKRAFAFTLPAQSVKPMLFKAHETIWKVIRNVEGKLAFESQVVYEKIAVFGVRACDLRAIAIQDRIFIDDAYQDIRYLKRRENQFLIAMNCTSSHNNCFCVSLGDSPRATSGFDLAMTEVNAGFVVAIGSALGQEVMDVLNLPKASPATIEGAASGITFAANQQTKSIPPIHEVATKLIQNLEHPQYDDIANRCLSCGNCTNSCPTCFCHTEIEEPTISGNDSCHVRKWDSCFTLDHSYTHGETAHENPKHRYRQWLTHKFGTWYEQFQTNGCVGCGRCITWCPVHIDITDEIKHICK